jgi:hypothetical protein
MKEWSIQEAVFKRLKDYEPLTDLISAVYDHVPQNAVYPYVVIGDDTSIAWDTDDSLGSESTLTIHVWSRLRGRKETKLIQEQIYNALNRYELEITGLHTIDIISEFAETFLDADGITRHGVQRFRLITEES